MIRVVPSTRTMISKLILSSEIRPDSLVRNLAMIYHFWCKRPAILEELRIVRASRRK